MWVFLAIGISIPWFRSRAVCSRTTLTAAWWWLGVSLAAVIGVQLAVWDDLAIVRGTWRYIAATSLICPFMAVLGAKRPQHNAWQFVVGTLWFVMSLPGWEAWAYGATEVRPDALRSAVLGLLLALTWINWLGTRFWFAVSCAVAGQVLLLAPFLPGLRNTLFAEIPLEYGVGILLIGALVADYQVQHLHWPALDTLDDYSQLWRNWRDLFGTIWSFRVLERMQAATAGSECAIDLTWSGFMPTVAGAQTRILCPAVRTALRGLLRRFLDEECFCPAPGTPQNLINRSWR